MQLTISKISRTIRLELSYTFTYMKVTLPKCSMQLQHRVTKGNQDNYYQRGEVTVSSKANPNTYKENIIRTINGTGDTYNPSPNACKLELLTPETFICFESKYMNLPRESFASIANKCSTSLRTVSTYYKSYKELRDAGILIEFELEPYLKANGKEYPIIELPNNNYLSITEQLNNVLDEIQSLKQSQDYNIKLQEQNGLSTLS